MKNKYEVRGDTTVIFARQAHVGVVEVLIDTDDLPLADSMPHTWSVQTSRRGRGQPYVRASTRLPDRENFLARLLMQPGTGLEVDHINHDTLDNRRSNLRAVPKWVNQHNRPNAAGHGKSGVRGVLWDKEINKWRVRIRVNNRKQYVGVFTSIEDASTAYERALADAIESELTGGRVKA